ncbi:Chloroperoxidase [Aspergillus pseudoustus]|uniref:Chloroperoxidase n=1 Tax=Aspergillus pseudoustus TaxID=1810923 RepID=A0ABR4IP78_9EURO
MKITILACSALLTIAAACDCENTHERHEWRAPGPNNSRSPCPGLNAMANHGFLPRNGRDISLTDLHAAITSAYNYAPETLDNAFQMALDFNLSTTGNSKTIHLSDLNKHNAIEHDGSLSRSDFNLGDNHSFDPEVWNSTATHLGLYDAGVDCESDLYVTVEVAARARALRFREAEALNPAFNASAGALMGSVGETALYLTTLWDYAAGTAPKAWIRAFFEEERIPYLEGFRAPKTQRNLETLGAMNAAIQAVKV